MQVVYVRVWVVCTCTTCIPVVVGCVDTVLVRANVPCGCRASAWGFRGCPYALSCSQEGTTNTTKCMLYNAMGTAEQTASIWAVAWRCSALQWGRQLGFLSHSYSLLRWRGHQRRSCWDLTAWPSQQHNLDPHECRCEAQTACESAQGSLWCLVSAWSTLAYVEAWREAAHLLCPAAQAAAPVWAESPLGGLPCASSSAVCDLGPRLATASS